MNCKNVNFAFSRLHEGVVDTNCSCDGREWLVLFELKIKCRRYREWSPDAGSLPTMRVANNDITLLFNSILW